MSNWIANTTGIHISPKRTYVDRKQFGGAVSKLAPLAAAFIPGVGPAALVGGLGSAIGRGIQPGANFGDIAKAGAIGGAASGGLHALRSAFVPGSSPMANTIMSSDGAGGWTQTQGPGAEGALSRLAHGFGSGAKKLGTMAKENPLVVGQIAGGVLDAKQNSEAMDFQRQQYDDKEARRRRLQEMLAPLLSSYTGAR